MMLSLSYLHMATSLFTCWILAQRRKGAKKKFDEKYPGGFAQGEKRQRTFL
jgi:hypothetical protein